VSRWLAVLQVASVVVGLLLVHRAVRRPPDEGRPGGRTRGRRRIGPLGAWSAVVALIYLNQVLVVVYVRRVWDGDTGGLTRHLPAGWFELPAPGGPLDALVAAFPAPELLAPSVMRVNSVLELPFAVLAYLAVAARLDRRTAATLARPELLAAACWAVTLAFCCIEVWLGTPFTGQDVALRLATAAVLPSLLPRVVHLDGDPAASDGPIDRATAAHLVAFTVWATAFAVLVLAVYSTALLYDLARVPSRASGAAMAVAVLAAAEVGVRRARAATAGGRNHAPGPLVGTAGAGLRWFTLLFWVPALPLRYGLGFGSAWIAAAGFLVVVAVALVATVLEVAGHHRPRPRTWWPRWGVGVCACVGVGLMAVVVADRGLPAWGDHTEDRLLVVTAVLLLGSILAAAVLDRLVPPPVHVFEQVHRGRPTNDGRYGAELIRPTRRWRR